MGGFRNLDAEEIVFADNVDFSGDGNPSATVTSNGQLLIGSTAVPNIRVGALTSPDASITIGYSAPNITLTAGAALGTVQELTPDFDFDGTAATPIEPISGNINVLSYNPSVANVTNTYNSTGASTGDMKVEHKAWLTALVVDPSSTIGSRGTFQTIASALTAASSGQDIFIRPGTYTENLTLKAGVNLVGFIGDGQTAQVTIIGNCTASFAGTCTISGIRLQTNAANCLTVSGASATVVNVTNCYINCSNNTGISYSSSSSSSSITLNNCYGNLGTTGIAFFAHSSAGTLNLNYCRINNTGGSTTASTASAGRLMTRYSAIDFAISTSGTNIYLDEFCEHDTNAINTVALTHDGASSSACRHCYFESGTASAVSINSQIFLQSCIVNSSNTNVVTGAGNLSYTPIHLSNPSEGNVNVTTQVVRPFGPSVRVGCINSGAANVLTVDNGSNTASSTANCVVQVAGGTAGDATHQSAVAGVTTWTWGIDNSDSDAYVLAQGTALGTNNVMRSSVAGEINYPLQPSFLAQSAAQADVTGDGTTYTAQFTSEIFDQGGDFDGTSTFTAPVTGRYQFNISLTLAQLAAGHTTGTIALTTSNRTYTLWGGSPFAQANAAGALKAGFSVLADMDAADTATVSVTVSGATKVVDIQGTPASCFSGQLLA